MKRPRPWSNICLGKNLILLACGPYGNVIRFLMPLVITDEQLEKGLAIIEEGLVSTRQVADATRFYWYIMHCQESVE